MEHFTRKIISVHSFRGGTGKSNIVANLAVTIALQGYRVGIVDTDIQSPGIHVLFNFDSSNAEYSLNDYLWERCPIEKAAYDVSYVMEKNGVQTDGKVYLIPSSLRVNEITKILREGYDVGLLNEGFQQLLEVLNLDYLLIDTHPGINEETLLSITISDLLLLILRPDQQDFQGTAVTVDIARQLEVPEMFLIVNKVPSSYEIEAIKQKVEQAYNVPIAGILPLSEQIIELGSSDIFCLRFPHNPVVNTIKNIAKISMN